MTSEMLYNYVTCFKNAFSISGDLRLSCVQISLISDTGPILAIREPCPLKVFHGPYFFVHYFNCNFRALIFSCKI